MFRLCFYNIREKYHMVYSKLESFFDQVRKCLSLFHPEYGVSVIPCDVFCTSCRTYDNEVHYMFQYLSLWCELFICVLIIYARKQFFISYCFKGFVYLQLKFIVIFYSFSFSFLKQFLKGSEFNFVRLLWNEKENRKPTDAKKYCSYFFLYIIQTVINKIQPYVKILGY